MGAMLSCGGNGVSFLPVGEVAKHLDRKTDERPRHCGLDPQSPST